MEQLLDGRTTSGSRAAQWRDWILGSFCFCFSCPSLYRCLQRNLIDRLLFLTTPKPERKRECSLLSHSLLLKGAFWLAQLLLSAHCLDQSLRSRSWSVSHRSSPTKLNHWAQEWESGTAGIERKSCSKLRPHPIIDLSLAKAPDMLASLHKCLEGVQRTSPESKRFWVHASSYSN